MAAAGTTFYRIKANGTASVILKGGPGTEGLEVIPNLPRYGKLAGTLLGTCGGCAEGYMYAIQPNGSYTSYSVTGCYTDHVFLVYPGDNFFGVSFGTGQILGIAVQIHTHHSGARWAELAPLSGEIIVLCEGWNSKISNSGIFHVFWNFDNDTFGSESIGFIVLHW